MAHSAVERDVLLRAGFACWRDDHLEIPWHPHAIVVCSPGYAALCVAGFAPAGARAEAWADRSLTADSCLVGIIPSGLGAPDPHDASGHFIDLLEAGDALIAEVGINQLGKSTHTASQTVTPASSKPQFSPQRDSS